MTVEANISYQPKILVVDDVEANLSLVCRRLDNGVYKLRSADSGEKALAMIEESKPDLVLLDYMMPTMNGLDVLRVVREEWGLDELPVIMLTARAENEAVIAALNAGADDYISKPIDFEVLKARIETQLSKLKSNSDLRHANAALDERVAMRVLAFDQLREELEREISQRKAAERALAEIKASGVPSGTTCIAPDEIDNALEVLDRISDAATRGKPINLALLSMLRSKIEAFG